MRGIPVHAGKIDTANVTQLLLFLDHPTDGLRLRDRQHPCRRPGPGSRRLHVPAVHRRIRAVHPQGLARQDPFRRGTDRPDDQPRKEDLKAHARPKNWNKYGGWADGPRLKATGFFRVQKHKGKWWLVDPTGRLFWSHGIDCVRAANADADHQSRAVLPQPARPGFALGAVLRRGGLGPPRLLQGPHAVPDLRFHPRQPAAQVRRGLRADLRRRHAPPVRKLGDQYDRQLVRRADLPVCDRHPTRPRSRSRPGSWRARKATGASSTMSSIPASQANLRQRLEQERGQTAGDPWCIGYFVHNELAGATTPPWPWPR